MKTLAPLFLLFLFYGFTLSPTKVGNGDDGADLESFIEVKNGPLKDTQEKATRYLQKLSIQGIPGLGKLLPEVERAKLFITKSQLPSSRLKELGAYQNDSGGLVYARTFPRPYAATRFFPAALQLQENQLIALHIHEALHRALPEHLRENESLVTRITLAITTPQASHDDIKKEMDKIVRDYDALGRRINPPPKSSKLYRPSYISSNFQHYFGSKKDGSIPITLPVENELNFESFLYPFGDPKDDYALGTGLEANYIYTDDEQYFGHLGLILSMKIWTFKRWDGEFFVRGQYSGGTESKTAGSLKDRDLKSIGFNFHKFRQNYYFENGFEFIFEDEWSPTILAEERTFKIGHLGVISLEGGRKFGKWLFGGVTKAYYLKSFDLRSVSKSFQRQGSMYFGFGPKFTYLHERWSYELNSFYLFETANEDDFDYLGDLLGQGLGQLTLGLNIKFSL